MEHFELTRYLGPPVEKWCSPDPLDLGRQNVLRRTSLRDAMVRGVTTPVFGPSGDLEGHELFCASTRPKGWSFMSAGSQASLTRTSIDSVEMPIRTRDSIDFPRPLVRSSNCQRLSSNQTRRCAETQQEQDFAQTHQGRGRGEEHGSCSWIKIPSRVHT